jgi:ABC-2 type transport system ATP-binding protein
MTAISFHHATKRYGDITAVDNISFELATGSITGFVGVNGAGKSTALRMLLGLSRPTSGSAQVLGRAYADLDAPMGTVGALTDPDVFHPGRTGRNALRVCARAGDISDERVEEVLALVELNGAAGRRVGGYSMGMRQRLGLALALLGDPQVLVLDEPANGLDPVGIHWLRGFLRGLADAGRTVLVSSHQLAELGQTVDDVVFIHAGRLVARGTCADLMREHSVDTLEQLFLEVVSTAGSVAS